MNIFSVLVAIVLCYLLGSVNGSLVLGRFKNVDIRSSGSGNAGGTNAFRTQGLKFALAVIIIDIGKAVLAVWLAKIYLPQFSVQADIAICLCAAAVVIGHCYPIWHGFKGGKGVATYAGVVLALIPQYLPLALLIIVALVILTGYVSFASITTAALVPVMYAMTTPDFMQLPIFWCLIFISTFIFITHRGNIRKLLSGTENRFEKARLLHRWLNKQKQK